MKQQNFFHHWATGRRLIRCVLALFLLAAACQPIQPEGTTSGTNAERGATGATAVAFVRDKILYIQADPPNGQAVPVEDCSTSNCQVLHLKWAPDGQHLLYYHGSFDGSVPSEIRLADRAGTVQTVATGTGAVRPADWSPTGDAIVYLLNTERIVPSDTLGSRRALEVWSVPVNGDGALGQPQLVGEVGFSEGCGGGGRSESANAYEHEGGFAYGYLAGIVNWAANDILLYSNNCGSRGVGRFDLATGQELEAYEGELRSLSLNAPRDQWVAINTENQLVLGTPDSLEVQLVTPEQQPELVFFGQMSGDIYYTTLTVTSYVDLVDTLAALDPNLNVSPYFDFTQPSLRVINLSSMAETALWEDDSYAYARVTEGIQGELFFSRVENGQQLYDALEQGEINAENLASFLPQVDVMRLSPDTATPEVWLSDASQFTLTQP